MSVKRAVLATFQFDEIWLLFVSRCWDSDETTFRFGFWSDDGDVF